ncbi:MAG: SDR family oxidoreductase [Planctomycetota bacterium]|nr:MAG: SDR family oxidoreductase [Planctomycetota bacterium]
MKDKVVIVTGGSSGFGLEAARILLKMGSKVIITGRNKERLDKAAKDLDHENLLPVQADACKTEDWKKLIDKALARFGKIDVLVNNHGAGVKVTEVENLTDEQVQAILDINIISVIKGCREVIKVMKKQGSGHIVNVSSGCAHQSWPCWATYTAAKGGMLGFTRCLHLEMAEWGGKATNFVPGAARTGFCDAVGIDDNWLEGYPGAYEFARTLVHCIDVPENSVVEEVSIWGTKQIKEMLNPF